MWYVLFFLSGFSSLLFEIVWQRAFHLAFGASAPAIVAVLTAFFAGMALGCWIAPGLMARVKSAVRFYSLCEGVIALGGLAAFFLIPRVDAIYTHLFDQNTVTGLAGQMFRFVATMALVLPATAAMGATIPAMTEILEGLAQKREKSVSLAYGVNTLGALTGCLVTGLVLLPEIGMRWTAMAGAFNSLLIFGAAFVASQKIAPYHRKGGEQPMNWRWLGCYAGAGFCALGLEVVWFRVLAILNTNGHLTFTLGLFVYLLGFSLGSLVLFPRLLRKFSAARVFEASFLAAASLTLLSAWFAYWIPQVRMKWTTGWDTRNQLDLWRVGGVELLSAVVLMFLPAVALGFAFPAVCEVVAGPGGDRKTSSARVYFWGTVGSAAGALAVGFWIIPQADILGSLALLILLQLALCWRVRVEAHLQGVALPVVALVTGIAAAIWWLGGPPYVRHGGLVRHEDTWIQGKWAVILSYQSGRSATVMVKEQLARGAQPSVRRLYIDDQPVAATDPGGIADLKMLAHIPLMLHPDPRRVLTVGFGSGGTSWSMSLYGIETHAVEIEPVVLQMAKFFENQNQGVPSRPNFRVFLNDARDHLHVSKVKYDVIATDVTNLQYKQNASLYTREYFQLMRDRLNEDGVACVWIPLVGIATEELKTLMRTFQSVYPHASLWYMDQVDTTFGILIGTPGPTRFSMKRLKEVAQKAEIVDDLGKIYIGSVYEAIQFMLLDEDGYRKYAGEGPLHTDDRPILEFSSPAAFYLGPDYFERILQDLYASPRRPMMAFLTDANESDLLLIGRYQRFARLRSEMKRLMILASFEPSPVERREIRARARATGEEALRMFPQRAELEEVVDWLRNHPD